MPGLQLLLGLLRGCLPQRARDRDEHSIAQEDDAHTSVLVSDVAPGAWAARHATALQGAPSPTPAVTAAAECEHISSSSPSFTTLVIYTPTPLSASASGRTPSTLVESSHAGMELPEPPSWATTDSNIELVVPSWSSVATQYYHARSCASAPAAGQSFPAARQLAASPSSADATLERPPKKQEQEGTFVSTPHFKQQHPGCPSRLAPSPNPTLNSPDPAPALCACDQCGDLPMPLSIKACWPTPHQVTGQQPTSLQRNGAQAAGRAGAAAATAPDPSGPGAGDADDPRRRQRQRSNLLLEQRGVAGVEALAWQGVASAPNSDPTDAQAGPLSSQSHSLSSLFWLVAPHGMVPSQRSSQASSASAAWVNLASGVLGPTTPAADRPKLLYSSMSSESLALDHTPLCVT